MIVLAWQRIDDLLQGWRIVGKNGYALRDLVTIDIQVQRIKVISVAAEI
jgi:hypothetical protein